MEKPYFVMLQTQRGDYTPLMESDEEIAKFETEAAARECAKQNPFGDVFGYDVFNIACSV